MFKEHVCVCSGGVCVQVLCVFVFKRYECVHECVCSGGVCPCVCLCVVCARVGVGAGGHGCV